MRLRSLSCDRHGAAAAEMALVAPLLIGLMLGSVEIGNFFWNQHTLEKGARDGARYAARQSMGNYAACSGAPTGTVVDDTKTIVRTGSLDSNANALLPNWNSATFSVTMSCSTSLTTSAGNEAPKGIYANMTTGAPTVLVVVSLPYRPIIGSPMGFFTGQSISLNARQSASVAGV